MRTFVFGTVCLLSLASLATAQGYVRPQTNPFNRPTVSPYVNLGRGFGRPGINYFGIIRPQQQLGAEIQGLQQRQLGLANADQDQNGGFPNTGHSTRFFNYSHYFQNQGGLGTVTQPGANVRPAVQQQALTPGILGGNATTRPGTKPGRPDTGAPAPRRGR